MPAPRVSQKLSGNPKGKPQRGIRFGPTEIGPDKLGQITLNRDAIQALTLANAKVQVTISAGGTTAILVSEETGKQIGGLDDLAKLLGIRSFVTKEKKLSASSDVQQEILTAAFHANQHVVSVNPTFEQKKLDNSFVVAAKPYKSMAELMDSRLDAIDGNHHSGSKDYKGILRFYSKGIMSSLSLTLAEMIQGEKEKGKLDAFLFEHGVPSYVKTKLLIKSLATDKDTDLSRILFPQDPSKGLALTVKEWRSPDFVKKQSHLMIGSNAIINILQDDKLFLELIGMTAEQFSNAEDPRVQRVLKTRILVVPPFADHKRVLEPLSRASFRGFSLPATAMDQSKDRLSNLCAVFIRAYAFSVRMAETIPDFFNRILPKGTIQPADEKLGNYAKQVLDALERGIKCDLTEQIWLDKEPNALKHWIARECKIIPDGEFHKEILRVLAKPKTVSTDKNSRPGTPQARPIPFVMTSTITTGAELDKFKSFRKNATSIKEKSVNKKRTPASSVLKRETKIFLKNVAKEHNPSLAEAMESYFRGFYAEEIQSAAVRIAEARFDELDDIISEDDTDDSDSDDASDDDEDDE